MTGSVHNVPDPGAPPVFNQHESLACAANLDSLPHAYGRPTVSGIIRQAPGDFVVAEILPFQLSGAGEHLYLRIRKTGQNTRWVARQLAKRFDLAFRSVSYAGLKDRHAATEQWFSLHLPGQPDPDLTNTAIDGVEVVKSSRHSTKLRRGMLAGNRFRIILRDLSGDLSGLEARLRKLSGAAIPNYFGAQRFGKEAGNLKLLEVSDSRRTPSREARSFGLSAIRSALFNGYLAERIADDTWHQILPGEIVYDESREVYRHVDRLAGLDNRHQSTGLLWGCGENKATGPALAKETEYFGRFPDFTNLLSAYEVRMMRRPLSLRLPDLAWSLSGHSLQLSFTLRRGMYATVVLREIANLSEPVRP